MHWPLYSNKFSVKGQATLHCLYSTRSCRRFFGAQNPATQYMENYRESYSHFEEYYDFFKDYLDDNDDNVDASLDEILDTYNHDIKLGLGDSAKDAAPLVALTLAFLGLFILTPFVSTMIFRRIYMTKTASLFASSLFGCIVQMQFFNGQLTESHSGVQLFRRGAFSSLKALLPN